MNENLKLREYENESKLKIDGRNIPYRLITASDYLLAKKRAGTLSCVTSPVPRTPRLRMGLPLVWCCLYSANA